MARCLRCGAGSEWIEDTKPVVIRRWIPATVQVRKGKPRNVKGHWRYYKGKRHA